MSHSDEFFYKRRRRKRIAISFVFVVTLLIVGVGVAGLAVADGVSRAGAIKVDINNAQVAVVDRDFARASEHLAKATTEMEHVNNRLLSLKILQPVPWVGKRIQTLLALVEDGAASVEAIQVLVSIGVDIENDLKTAGFEEGLANLEKYSELDPDERRELVFALNRAVPDLEEVRARLRQQRRELERINGEDLFIGLGFVQEELLEQIGIIDNTLELAVPILSILPDVAGFNGDQNYLIFLQNTGELRPTGGFWGTYGVLTLRNGDIESIETDDIYAVDAPSVGNIDSVPPLPLQRYLGVDDWYLRDANWSPDVPTSIRRAFEFYKNEVNVPKDKDWPVTAPNIEFDGAILVTPEVATKLLELLGDVEIGNVTFTPNTFFDVLEYEVEQSFVVNGTPVEERKDVIGKLIDVLFERFEEADSPMLGVITEETLNLLANNDIIMYSTEPSVQRIFEKQSWSGDLRVNAEHDHLLFVDANLASLKTDAELNRAYTYSIHRDAGGDLIASAQINYDHLGGFDYRTTRYRSYARVYVPFGSELIGVNGSLLDDRTKNPDAIPGKVDISEDFGATVFGAFTSVEPGATGSIEFVYKLPSRISDMVSAGEYVLDVQRQAGVGHVALNLDLDFDKPIVSASPEEISEFWYDDSYTYTTKAIPFQTFVMTF